MRCVAHKLLQLTATDQKGMSWITLCLLLASYSALLPVAPQALATDFCIVQESADGYVALRATPSANGDLLVRAKPGEAVVIQKTTDGDQIVSGQWLRVMHFPDAVVPQKTDPTFERGRIGWMHKRFVNECG